ncbi:Clr5 domain-containing protein [Neurospora crassa]|nr:Clr5 domain-containing protein [Neurospora crassa]
MTTDAFQEDTGLESTPASPTPDDIIAAFLARQDDIVMYGQCQEDYSSPSLDEDPRGQQEHLFTPSNTFNNALLSPPSMSLAGFQQDFQLPSPPQSRSASPSWSVEPAFRHRRTSSHPRKTGRNGGSHVRRHTTLSTSPKGHMAHTPMVPRKAEDWEPWKNVIHQLYIVQNHILKDIIVIMENTYQFKATPKMYKNQFARWNFFKYAIKRRSRSGTDTCSGSDASESTEQPWMIDQDHKPEEMQADTPVFSNDCDGPLDAYPSHYLDDSPSASQKPSYRFPSPQEELAPFCLDSDSSLAQQMIMTDLEGKDLATRWNRGDFGPDFAHRLHSLYNKVTAMSDSGQSSKKVSKAIQRIYCGWMSDYYESTQQWSEVFEWKKRGLSMTSNQQYVACSMRLEEMLRDHGSSEEAEELRRARMDIGWLMSGMLPGLFECLAAR